MTPSLQNVVVCSDGIHCGDCPHLKPYGGQYDLTAKCDIIGKDLMWHDYWIAECSPGIGELNVKPDHVTTPFWAGDGVTIYHGDCRDVIPQLPMVDLVLTDPPYGMAYNSGWTKVNAAIRSDGVRQGVRLLRSALFELQPKLAADAHFYTFCHWESWPDFYDSASSYFNLRNALIWWKNRGGMGDLRHEYAKDYEVILFGARGRRELTGSRDGCVIEGIPPCNPNGRRHPTEKPVALMRYFIEKSCPPGGVVVDPFCGAGAVLEAARECGRIAIGIDLVREHCESSRDRLAQRGLFTQNPSHHDGAASAPSVDGVVGSLNQEDGK